MARVSATRQFKTIFPVLEKQYGRRETYKERPPVEQVLITLLLTGGKEGPAEEALERLRQRFVDLNEVRVGDPDQLDEFLGDDYPAGTGTRITDALTAIFNNAQAMTLEPIAELEPEDALAELTRMEKLSSRAVGELVLAYFGYDKLPETEGLLRVAARTGLVKHASPESQMRSLRRTTPKTQRARVFHTFEMHAERICTRKDYDCPNCPINEHCPTGQETLERLRIQQEKERAAQKAEAERLKRKRNRERRTQERKQAATAKLKKTIEARSKELNLSAKSRKKRKKERKKKPATSSKATMVQASSDVVKTKPKQGKKKKRTSRSRRRSRSSKKTSNRSSKRSSRKKRK
ncbi:MAG: hypothetical protein ACOC8E_06060 [Planctomycetota bacterium]